MATRAVMAAYYLISLSQLAMGQPQSVLPPSSSSSDFFGRLLANDQAAAPLDPQSLQLATYDQRQTPAVLTRGDELQLIATNQLAAANSWWVAPAGNGLVRVESYADGRVYAVTAQRGGRVSLLPLAQEPGQLWRVSGGAQWGNRYVLESVFFPATCLTHLGGGRVAVQPLQFATNQLWVPLVPPPLPNFQPFYRTLSHQVQANPPLPPAQIQFFNSHRNALIVLLSDRRSGFAGQEIQIEANAAQLVTLDRDAGATIIETIETLSPFGGWERQQFTTSIPPTSFYDISVYEIHLQSIAIDRTGKSPNPIEDVNYAPKSVGWFPIAAGPSLPAAGRLDVFAQAEAANNPGAVRRLDLEKRAESPTEDRLEKILQEFQPAPPRRKF